MSSRAVAMLATALIMTTSSFPVGPESWRADGLGSAEASELEPSVSTITSDQLAEKLARKEFFFVNVHIPYEGEIEQTDAFIQFDKSPRTSTACRRIGMPKSSSTAGAGE
jgi:hypothetical protein